MRGLHRVLRGCFSSQTPSSQKHAELFSLFSQSTSQTPPELNLVVLHGLFGSHTNFRSIVRHPSIMDIAHTYCVDLRNHGLSEHKSTCSLREQGGDLVNFLQTKELKNVVLMGHSMGGRAIMSALQYHKQELDELVKGIVICDIAPGNLISERTADVTEMWVMINRLLDIEFGRRGKAAIEKDVRAAIPNPQVAGFMMMNVVENDDDRGTYRWRINLSAIRDSYIENLSTEIKDVNWTGPRTIIYGSRSHFVNQSKIEEFRSVFSDLEYDRDVHFIRGAGHWLHADKPVEFTEKVAQFLQTLLTQKKQ